jgi:signal transduction histidine kinase
VSAVLRRHTSRTASDADTRSLLSPKKILAVDDSPTYLQALTEALKGEGYDVVLARSGEEAIELLAVQSVDCILLDLVMPGLSGYETCQRIKVAPVVREIPLILITGHDNRESMIQGLGAGADDYIQKSGEFEVLKARVRAQIRRKQLEDEHRRIREELLRKELEAVEAHAARQLAETRAALVEELERANQDLEAFSYSVSHDLRAPLRAVSGFSAILESEFAAEMPERARMLLSRVTVSARRMEQLIEDLLLFSRTGRQPLAKRRVDIKRLVQDTVDELRQQQADREVDVRVGDLGEAVADPALIRQVLTNLLSNAFKFTRNAAPAVVEVSAEPRAGEVEYAVRDNGAGFDPRYADRLFGVFQRLHHVDEFEGTGVGLSIVQRIVQRHGGRVWAESAPGQGATFRFTLPD